MIPDFNEAIPDKCWDCRVCRECLYKKLYLEEHPDTFRNVYPSSVEEQKEFDAAWENGFNGTGRR